MEASNLFLRFLRSSARILAAAGVAFYPGD